MPARQTTATPLAPELEAIAAAEQVGQARARGALGPDALKRIARASRGRREADAEYEQEILRGDRLGLTHREIATAAEVAHGTVRAILARTDASTRQPRAPTPPEAFVASLDVIEAPR
jgi:hypothetical protein